MHVFFYLKGKNISLYNIIIEYILILQQINLVMIKKSSFVVNKHRVIITYGIIVNVKKK